jgi:SAM-dependent methyltransferase
MRTTSLPALAGVVLVGVFSLGANQASAQSPLYGQQHAKHYANSLAPYVVSPQEIVDRMLELADLKPGEKLYDLGSGDGRILITAVVRFKAKAVGVEISDDLVNSTNTRIRRLGLDNDAQVIHGNFLDVDLSPADVVTLYLATDTNEMLRPNLEKYLKNGSRVVSHDYRVPGWKPKLVDKNPDNHGHVIYLYEMPPKKK